MSWLIKLRSQRRNRDGNGVPEISWGSSPDRLADGPGGIEGDFVATTRGVPGWGVAIVRAGPGGAWLQAETRSNAANR